MPAHRVVCGDTNHGFNKKCNKKIKAAENQGTFLRVVCGDTNHGALLYFQLATYHTIFITHYYLTHANN